MSRDKMQASRGLMRDLLGELGYTENLLHEDYAFSGTVSAKRNSKETQSRADLVAFSQTLPSFRTACIGFSFQPGETPQTLTRFRSLGAPLLFSINLDTDKADYWKMPSTGLPQRIDSVSLKDISHLFDEKKQQWSPDTIERARAIGFQPGAAQLDFFDAGYLPALETQLSEKLKRDLNRILDGCKKQYLAQHTGEITETVAESLFRLLFRLLAAKYLIDRGKRPQWQKFSAEETVIAVETLFFKGRTTDPVFEEEPIRGDVWKAIREGLNLTNLSPEISADLYENLLVSKEIRKQYSVHATRLEVADYVLQHLPLDLLPQNERKVFEPFCGHAPFLTSAMTRMRALETVPMTDEQRHDYFQKMLIGMEVSTFSRELGLCSLILADDANGNSWQIDEADGFRSPDFDRHLQWANVVLCNPPFENFSHSFAGKPENATYDTQAAEALHRVLMHPPALLGFVLPRVFVENTGYNALREQVVLHYKNVSVVTLPERAFRETNTETALLIAHNLGTGGTCYASSSVNKDQWEMFRLTRKTFEPYESPTLTRNKKGLPRLWQPPLKSLWDYLKNAKTLNDHAKIRRGIEYRRLVEERVFDDPQSYTRPGLQVHDGYLEAYYVKAHQHLSVAPEEMLYKAYQLPWHLPKLLVNRLRSGTECWRIVGVVDDEGLVASDNFYGVWSRSEMPLELIAALINSPVVNAHTFAFNHGRHNALNLLASAPVPDFTEEQTEIIVLLVQEYAEKRMEWYGGSDREAYLARRCKELMYEIDAAVLEAYALPAELERDLLSRFEGVQRNPLPFEFTGYGAEYARAKEVLQREKLYNATMKRYQSLVDKKFDTGISEAEGADMKRLDKELNTLEEIYYSTLRPA